MISRGLCGVVAGGESGPDARPSHRGWFKGIRDQCAAAGVPFFFKAWGEWGPPKDSYVGSDALDGKVHWWPQGRASTRIGKRRAGRLLDGREHNDTAWGGKA
jgi:hypothetical protein